MPEKNNCKSSLFFVSLENDTEHQDLVQSLNMVKEVITAVDSKVSNYEKKTRLHEIYTRTDSKSIMRMKSGQMFAREDLRRRKFVRDGLVSLKNAAGRLKGERTTLYASFPPECGLKVSSFTPFSKCLELCQARRENGSFPFCLNSVEEMAKGKEGKAWCLQCLAVSRRF